MTRFQELVKLGLEGVTQDVQDVCDRIDIVLTVKMRQPLNFVVLQVVVCVHERRADGDLETITFNEHKLVKASACRNRFPCKALRY